MVSTMGEGPAKARLFIGGLDAEITAEQLSSRFSKMKGVLSVSDVSVHHAGTIGDAYAFLNIEAESDQLLAKCVSVYDKSNWKGRRLRVERSKPDYRSRFQVERDAEEERIRMEALAKEEMDRKQQEEYKALQQTPRQLRVRYKRGRHKVAVRTSTEPASNRLAADPPILPHQKYVNTFDEDSECEGLPSIQGTEFLLKPKVKLLPIDLKPIEDSKNESSSDTTDDEPDNDSDRSSVASNESKGVVTFEEEQSSEESERACSEQESVQSNDDESSKVLTENEVTAGKSEVESISEEELENSSDDNVESSNSTLVNEDSDELPSNLQSIPTGEEVTSVTTDRIEEPKELTEDNHNSNLNHSEDENEISEKGDQINNNITEEISENDSLSATSEDESSDEDESKSTTWSRKAKQLDPDHEELYGKKDSPTEIEAKFKSTTVSSMGEFDMGDPFDKGNGVLFSADDEMIVAPDENEIIEEASLALNVLDNLLEEEHGPGSKRSSDVTKKSQERSKVWKPMEKYDPSADNASKYEINNTTAEQKEPKVDTLEQPPIPDHATDNEGETLEETVAKQSTSNSNGFSFNFFGAPENGVDLPTSNQGDKTEIRAIFEESWGKKDKEKPVFKLNLAPEVASTNNAPDAKDEFDVQTSKLTKDTDTEKTQASTMELSSLLSLLQQQIEFRWPTPAGVRFCNREAIGEKDVSTDEWLRTRSDLTQDFKRKRKFALKRGLGNKKRARASRA